MDAAARARFFRAALSAALLSIAIGYVIWQLPVGDLSAPLASTSFLALFVAALFLCISQLLATVRLRVAAADLGHRLGYRDSLAAVVFGGLAGFIAFQIVGQIAARGTIFKRGGSSVQAAAAVTLYERAVAAVVLLIMAIGGAIYIFGAIGFEVRGGGSRLIINALGLSIASVAVAAFAWRDLLHTYVVPLVTWQTVRRVFRITAITVLIQLCTLISMVAVIQQFAGNVRLYEAAAASTIVMFAASLPISFAGWGVRELSSVVALGLVGVSPQASLTGSILFGVLSLVVVSLMAICAALWILRGTEERTTVRPPTPPVEHVHQGRAIELALCLVTAALVLFQIQVPLERGWVNVSPADLSAAAVGVLALFRLMPTLREGGAIVWFALAGTAVLLVSYLHGLFVFGKSDWAITRVLGWFILLAYAVVGAQLAKGWEIQGIRRLAATLGTAGVSIVVFSSALALMSLMPRRLEGFSGSTNALAFQLLICVAVVLVGLRQETWRSLLVIMLSAGVVLTGSLVGIGTLVLLGVVYLALVRRQAGRPALKPILLFIVGLVVVSTLIDVYYFATGTQLLRNLVSRGAGNVTASTVERARTIVDGLAIFQANPLFGAGLGHFYEHVFRKDGSALVIHSTPVWILAEFGLAGFGVAAAFTIYLLRTALQRPIVDGGMLIVLVVTVFASVGSVHDIFFQRVFWLALGAALAILPMHVQEPVSRDAELRGMPLAKPGKN